MSVSSQVKSCHIVLALPPWAQAPGPLYLSLFAPGTIDTSPLPISAVFRGNKQTVRRAYLNTKDGNTRARGKMHALWPRPPDAFS